MSRRVALLLVLAACTPDAVPGGKRAPPPADTDPPRPADPGGGDPPPCEPLSGPVLTEVSAANTSVLVDETGESVDWIEISNPGPDPVALAGWTLSDDADEPRKWAFPALELAPGGFLVLYASDRGLAEPVASWDTRVDRGDDWRFLSVDAPPDPDWFRPGFDDSAWPVGPSGFGRADDDDATPIPARTAYVRTPLNLTADELADLADVVLHVDYDDAFVAYVNGTEVARDAIGVSGLPPAWDELARREHEAGVPVPYPVDPALLVEGENTLAVEVHDISATSSDLSLVPILSLGFATPREGRPTTTVDLVPLQLHTNFSLRAEGEPVRLFDPTGCEADALEPGRMYADQSYGRTRTGELGYFLEPTPGAPNDTEARPGFAETPTFDPPPGHYPGGTSVSVTAAGEVHVTWEGWEPTEDDPLYTGALQTGATGEAVVLRARAYADDLWPSRIATATYLLRDPGELPIVSLVTDPPNLWDDDIGIHVLGPTYDPEPPFYGANFWEEWERPVHVEHFEPDGAPAFSVDAGVSIHGGRSRMHDQRNLLVELRSGYGDETIEHAVFPGLGSGSFSRLLYRAAGNDWHGCFSEACSEGAHLRDALMHRIARDSGVDGMAYRPAELYLNGEYFGVYEIRERPDAEWVFDHAGVEVEELDLLEMEGKAIHGDGLHYQGVLEYLRTHDLEDPAVWAHVETLVDVDELVSYLVLEVFYDNGDWPGNNIKYWRPRTPDGRWRWLLYDTDLGLGADGGRPTADTLAQALEPSGPNWPNPPWSTELFRLMLESPEFERTFLLRYADWLNTLLHPDATQAALDEVAGGLAGTIPRQVERWGAWTDGVTSQVMPEGTWEAEVERIRDWLADRPDPAREHVVTHFGLAGTWTLALDADPPGAGTFRLSSVEVPGPISLVYFQGVPVTVTAVPAPGFQFAGWSDGTAGASVVLDPSGPVSLVARFE